MTFTNLKSSVGQFSIVVSGKTHISQASPDVLGKLPAHLLAPIHPKKSNKSLKSGLVIDFMIAKVPARKAFNESDSGILKPIFMVWGFEVLCKAVDNIGLSNHGFRFFLDRLREAPTFGTVRRSLLGVLLLPPQDSPSAVGPVP